MATRVHVETQGAVTRIRFESENGIQILSNQTRRELETAVRKLNRQPDCRVVVFEATGRSFLAGAELTELQALTDHTAEFYALAGQRLMNAIAKMKAVTICAIHAACAGGGCELALACDLRPASEGARIGLPETGLGLIPGWGGTVRATRLLGPAKARRVILTGTLFPAQDALQLGLVDSVVPDDAFRNHVDQLVEQLLTRGPGALQRAKQLISELADKQLKKALRKEAREFAACYATGEPAEGIQAFREKRKPEWPKPSEGKSPTPATADGDDSDD